MVLVSPKLNVGDGLERRLPVRLGVDRVGHTLLHVEEGGTGILDHPNSDRLGVPDRFESSELPRPVLLHPVWPTPDQTRRFLAIERLLVLAKHVDHGLRPDTYLERQVRSGWSPRRFKSDPNGPRIDDLGGNELPCFERTGEDTL